MKIPTIPKSFQLSESIKQKVFDAWTIGFPIRYCGFPEERKEAEQEALRIINETFVMGRNEFWNEFWWALRK